MTFVCDGVFTRGAEGSIRYRGAAGQGAGKETRNVSLPSSAFALLGHLYQLRLVPFCLSSPPKNGHFEEAPCCLLSSLV